MAILEQLHRLKKEFQTEAQAAKITDHVLLLEVIIIIVTITDHVLLLEVIIIIVNITDHLLLSHVIYIIV